MNQPTMFFDEKDELVIQKLLFQEIRKKIHSEKALVSELMRVLA